VIWPLARCSRRCNRPGCCPSAVANGWIPPTWWPPWPILSGLECVRETLRLALEELAEALPEAARPACWPLLWDRYVESKVDYRSSAEALQDKFRQAGADGLGLLQWLERRRADLRYGTQVELLAEVFAQRFELKDNRPEPLEQSEGSAVQSPHDLRRAVRGQRSGQAAQILARV
jgi:hypothetical protein